MNNVQVLIDKAKSYLSKNDEFCDEKMEKNGNCTLTLQNFYDILLVHFKWKEEKIER